MQIDGRATCLTDLNVGMDAEATGLENIRMRGRLLGLSTQQITELVPDVAEFTELGDYLKLPVRCYSQGMLLRLAFGISTGIRPEIILLDEIIGVGDQTFAAKAQSRLQVNRCGKHPDPCTARHEIVLVLHISDLARAGTGGGERTGGRHSQSVFEEPPSPTVGGRMLLTANLTIFCRQCMPTSVITGITGQDGAYLAEQLLERGHTVYGTFRRTSSVNFWRLEELGILDHPNLKLTEFDLIDAGACLRLLDKSQPDLRLQFGGAKFCRACHSSSRLRPRR